jgi:hypothetical protein
MKLLEKFALRRDSSPKMGFVETSMIDISMQTAFYRIVRTVNDGIQEYKRGFEKMSKTLLRSSQTTMHYSYLRVKLESQILLFRNSSLVVAIDHTILMKPRR